MEDLNSTMVSFTMNNSSAPLSPPSWDFRGPISAGILLLCFLLGVPGNIAVIILKPNWEHLCSLSQSLMLNLTISDLLCLLPLPLWIYYLLSDWIFGLVACKLLECFEYICIYGRQLTVTVLSVHRYLLVVHQQRWLNKIGTRKLLALLWLVAMVLSTPGSVVRQLTRDHDRKRTRCSTRNVSDSQKLPVMLMEILVLSICLFVVAFAYFRVFKKVNEASFFNHAQTTRLVISITVTLFVLWIPFYSINVLGVAAISLQNERLWKSSVDIKDMVIALTFVNSCLNPLLYAFTSNYLYTVCCSCLPREINGQISKQQGTPLAAEP